MKWERGRQVARQVPVIVVGVWRGQAKALLGEQDGPRSWEVAAPAEIEPRVEPGMSAVLYLGERDEILGWSVPELEFGLLEE